MLFSRLSRFGRRASAPRLELALAALLVLAACSPPQPTSPRPTAQAILEITPAPTQNVDATATAYASRLVPTPTPAGLYRVQAGDTLSGLAEEFGTTVEELMAANGLTDANAIQAGQMLIIPPLASGAISLATAAPISGTVALTSTAVVTGTLAPVAGPTPKPGTPTPTLVSP